MVAFDMGPKKKRMKPREFKGKEFKATACDFADRITIWLEIGWCLDIYLKDAIRLRDWLNSAILYLSDKEKR